MYDRFFDFVQSLEDAEGIGFFEKPDGNEVLPSIGGYGFRIFRPANFQPNRFTVEEIEQMSDDQLALILLEVTFRHD